MNPGIAEILGIFVIVVGGCCLVGAAALISTALGVAVAGALLILAGAITVYAAAIASRRPKSPGE